MAKMGAVVLTYYKNIFVGRCRKGTPCGRFVLFSSAYPQRSVTEQNTQDFAGFFRAVFKCKKDKERAYFLTGVYIVVYDLRKT